MKQSTYAKQKLFLFDHLHKFKYSDTKYSLTKKKNLSVFATIFSIFIKDLFSYDFTEQERIDLGDYLNSYQDKNTGIFTENKCDYSPNFYSHQNIICGG